MIRTLMIKKINMIITKVIIITNDGDTVNRMITAMMSIMISPITIIR